jgi:hypothetical protein
VREVMAGSGPAMTRGCVGLQRFWVLVGTLTVSFGEGLSQSPNPIG